VAGGKDGAQHKKQERPQAQLPEAAAAPLGQRRIAGIPVAAAVGGLHVVGRCVHLTMN